MRIAMKKMAAALLCATSLLFSHAALAEFPDKPVTIYVLSPAGGFMDMMARLIGQRLSQLWSQPVIVLNHPGAQGVIGTAALARAPADGYTVGIIASNHAINPLVMKKLPYDPVRDFAWVAMLATSPALVVAHPSVQARDAKAAFDLAKANPGKYSYASAGQLAAGHRTMELLKRASGAQITNVPYSGGGPAMNDLLGGHVQFSAIVVSTAIDHVRTGRLRALGVTSLTRLEAFPDIPTIAESGFPGFEAVEWFAVAAPAVTPRVVIDKLSADIQRVLREKDVSDKLAKLGAVASQGGPAEVDTYYRKEYERWKKLVPELGLSLD
jgi:tripartite-type tricarboxylate transporter receptor subunit TctC